MHSTTPFGAYDPSGLRVGTLLVENSATEEGRVRLVWIGRRRVHVSTTLSAAAAEVLTREVVPAIVDELTVPIPGQMTFDDVLAEIGGYPGIDDEAA